MSCDVRGFDRCWFFRLLPCDVLRNRGTLSIIIYYVLVIQSFFGVRGLFLDKKHTCLSMKKLLFCTMPVVCRYLCVVFLCIDL
jgi:hypothetical protein